MGVCLPLQFRQLRVRVCQLEWRCKSLVFQKRYLKCEVDAFYHTQQASLMLLKDMGASVPAHIRSTSAHVSFGGTRTRGRQRFRVAARAIVAAVRLRYLYRKRSRHRTPAARSSTGSRENARGTESHTSQLPASLSEHRPLLSTHSSAPTSVSPSRAQHIPNHSPPPSSTPHSSKSHVLSHGLLSPPTSTLGTAPHSPKSYASSSHRLLSPPTGTLGTAPQSPKSHVSSRGLLSPPTATLGTGRAAAGSREPLTSARTGDSQVTAYLKRLEQLQERVNKTKRSSKH